MSMAINSRSASRARYVAARRQRDADGTGVGTLSVATTGFDAA